MVKLNRWWNLHQLGGCLWRQDRFPEDDLELLECFDIVLNPRRLPNGARELGNHGIEQLDKLSHQFQTVLDSDRCSNQFLQFKHLVRSYRAMNFEQFTSHLILEYKDSNSSVRYDKLKEIQQLMHG